MSDALNVWLPGVDHPVGELRRTSGLAVEFAYVPAVVARQDTRCTLSVRLPLRERPYADVDCRVFFDNLLPEGEPRAQVAAQHRLDQADILGLLAVLGADAPGAISVLPAGAPSQKQPGRLAQDYEPLTLPQLELQLTRLAEGRPPAPGLRFSLAGAQSTWPAASLPKQPTAGSRVG
jgi:serine/threonine-protein kinase HipA